MKEDQPSGPNPEWEANKEQNIVIAKRIDGLLLALPDALSRIKNRLQRHIDNNEEIMDIEKLLLGIEGEIVNDEGPLTIPESTQDAILIDELTIISTNYLSHVNNRHRHIAFGVGFTEEAKETIDLAAGTNIAADIEKLPTDFNFPVYVIRQNTNNLYDNSKISVSTVHGELPNDFIGTDGTYYKAWNAYCFNFSGQAVKIENIINMGSLENIFGEEKALEAREKFTHVGFFPSEEHSRVVPLGPEDYGKINKMFEDIDAGLYKA